MAFHKRLKTIRTEKKLSAYEAAKLARVPVSSYQEWENGRRIRDVEVYVKLSQAFDISLNELILGSKKEEQLQTVIADLQQVASSLQSAIKKLNSVSL